MIGFENLIYIYISHNILLKIWPKYHLRKKAQSSYKQTLVSASDYKVGSEN